MVWDSKLGLSDSLKGETSTLQVLALTYVHILPTLPTPYLWNLPDPCWVNLELWDIQTGELGDWLYQCPLHLERGEKNRGSKLCQGPTESIPRGLVNPI